MTSLSPVGCPYYILMRYPQHLTSPSFQICQRFLPSHIKHPAVRSLLEDLIHPRNFYCLHQHQLLLLSSPILICLFVVPGDIRPTLCGLEYPLPTLTQYTNYPYSYYHSHNIPKIHLFTPYDTCTTCLP